MKDRGGEGGDFRNKLKRGGGEERRLTSLMTKMAECHEQLGRVVSNGLIVQDPPWRKRYAIPLRIRIVTAFAVYFFLRRLQVISPCFPSPLPPFPSPHFLPGGGRASKGCGRGEGGKKYKKIV